MTDLVDRLGTTVGGKYRIGKFLAAGGMGAVYEALHVVVKRRFAVKFLRADLALRRDVLLRFQKEAEAAGALENENIAAAVDFGIAADGAPYIVMEYLAGVDLARLLSAMGPLPVERAADLVLQACRGIQAAHAAGVIHRDLKPENLFVCQRSDGSDLVKIVDFGIAKLQASDAGKAVTGTGAGGMVGTPSYMSPEQARGEALIDQRSDVYSLGVVLYELLSGQVPHPGDSYNAVIYHISTQPPAPLVCERRDLPRGLVEIVHRALSPERADRHASAEELAQALTGFARRVIWPSLVDHTTRLHDSRSPPEPGAQELHGSLPGSTRDAAAPERTSQLRRTPWVVAIGFAAAVGLLLAVRGLSRQPSEPDESSVRAASTPIVGLASPLANERPASPVEATASIPVAQTPEKHALVDVPISKTRPGRPPATRGRPEGRPAQSTAAPSAGASSGQATFDTRNPYE